MTNRIENSARAVVIVLLLMVSSRSAAQDATEVTHKYQNGYINLAVDRNACLSRFRVRFVNKGMDLLSKAKGICNIRIDHVDLVTEVAWDFSNENRPKPGFGWQIRIPYFDVKDDGTMPLAGDYLIYVDDDGIVTIKKNAHAESPCQGEKETADKKVFQKERTISNKVSENIPD